MTEALRSGVSGALILGSMIVSALLASQLNSSTPGASVSFQLTWMNLVFAVYAAALALFILWKVRGRPAATELVLLLALMSLSLSLSVVPGGEGGAVQRAAFAVSWTALIVQVVRFWTCFPEPMVLAEVAALANATTGEGWRARMGARAARWAHGLLSQARGWFALVLVAGLFGAQQVVFNASPYNFLGTPVEADFARTLINAPVSMTAISIHVLVASTAYRLAKPTGRGQVLWILLGHLISAFMALLAVGLPLLGNLTGSVVLEHAGAAVLVVFFPVGWFVTLSGYALALFMSGAFDLRPVIGRSTIYGAMVLTLTVVFAAVEELVEDVVSERLSLPDGVGTWVAAVTIAILLGPLQSWLKALSRQFVPDFDGSTRARATDP